MPELASGRRHWGDRKGQSKLWKLFSQIKTAQNPSKGPECRDACRCPAGLIASARGGVGLEQEYVGPTSHNACISLPCFQTTIVLCLVNTKTHEKTFNQLKCSPPQEYLQPRKSSSPQSLRIFVEKGKLLLEHRCLEGVLSVIPERVKFMCQP